MQGRGDAVPPRPFVSIRWRIFEIAGRQYARRRGAKLADAFGIGVRLHQAELEVAQQVAHHPAQPAVVGKGAVGEPAVRQHHGDVMPRTGPQKVGPDFRFENDDQRRLETGHGPFRQPRNVKRKVEVRVHPGELFPRARLSGVRGG